MVIFQFAMYHFGRMSRGECSSHHSTCTDLLPFLEIGPKTKKQKTKSFTRPLSSFSDPLYGSKLFFVFSRFWTLCQSNNVSCSFFLFLFSFSLGSWDKFSPWQASIGTAFTPPHFILMSSLSFRFWLLSHQRKCTVKTALSPTSSGTPLDWCFIGKPRSWCLIFKGSACALQTWNH